MLFRTALRLLVLGAATAARAEQDGWNREQEKEQNRKLKDDAVRAVQRFLWLFQSDDKGPGTESTSVKWDGRLLAPFKSDNSGGTYEAGRRTLTDETFELDGEGIMGDEDDDESMILEPLGFTESAASSGGGRRKARGRRKRRRRTTKSDKTKTPKSCKASKSSGSGSDLEVIRKKVKGSKSSAQEEILCFRGSFQDVTDACDLYNADCCQGVEACVWDEIEPPTVCQGSCNGPEACDRISQRSYIGENSCVGRRACRGINYDADSCQPVVVGEGACRGDFSCQLICFDSDRCTVEIGDSACEGVAACADMSSRSLYTESVVLGSYACTKQSFDDSRQCAFFGRGSNADIRIRDYACSGNRPCRRFGQESVNATLLEVKEGGCEGERACAYMARDSVVGSVVVEEDACYGTRSCIFAGAYNAQDILIQEGACVSYRSCFQIGGMAQSEVIVEKGACQEYQSCAQVGQNAVGDVSVGKEACTPDQACQAFGFVADYVYIGTKACNMEARQCSVLSNRTCRYEAFIPKNGQSCFD